MIRPDATSIQIVIPRPEPHSRIDELSVTGFRDYLACPYRFYLRHVLKLRSINDKATELDPLSFGSLIHDILRDFGKSRIVHSHSSEEIFAFLEGRLLHYAHHQFAEALPAVAVQVEQIRTRLEAFAAWQASWTKDGWRIVDVEVNPVRRKRTDGRPRTVLLGGANRPDRFPFSDRSGGHHGLQNK